MRVCPKCGDYYADDLLAFCLADGTPLVNVEPEGDQWSKGSRVVEEKLKRLNKQKRSTRLRWVVAALVTILMAAALMSRSFTIETSKVNPPSSPSPSPPSQSGSPSSSPTPSPSPQTTLSLPPSPSPSLSPSPSPSPSPVYRISGQATGVDKPLAGITIKLDGARVALATTDERGYFSFNDLSGGASYVITPVAGPTINFTPRSRSFNNLSRNESTNFVGQSSSYKISGRVTDGSQPLGGIKIKLVGTMLTAHTTDANGYYAFTDLRSGGSYTVTPLSDQTNFTPGNRSFTNLTQDESANFSGVVQRDLPPEVCTEDDQARARDALLRRYSGEWQRTIESEEARIIAETLTRNVPVGVEPRTTEATASLGAIRYEVAFIGCAPDTVTAIYEWKVSMLLNGTRKSVLVPKRRNLQRDGRRRRLR